MSLLNHNPDKMAVSWLLLAFCIFLHVIDEALNNFLDLYNPIVLKIKENIPFVPLPTFTFKIWITGLSIGILALIFLTPLVIRRKRFIMPVIRIFAVLMILNGLGHIIGSIYYSEPIAGMLSSPFLIISSAAVLYYSNK